MGDDYNWYRVQQMVDDGNNTPLLEWFQSVSRILLDLRERGVELKTAADPDVPYLDHN